MLEDRFHTFLATIIKYRIPVGNNISMSVAKIKPLQDSGSFLGEKNKTIQYRTPTNLPRSQA